MNPSPSTPEAGPARLHDLDALRSFAMLLGIALHAALAFGFVPWVTQDRSRHVAFDVFVQAVHGFRMPVFFLLSGFFTAMLWRRRGLRGLIGHRTKRILLPLALACGIIVPLMWGAIIWGMSTHHAEGKADTGKDVWTAAAWGNLPAVRRFIEGGADPDQAEPSFGQTPLAWSVICGRRHVTAYLLEAGADPNARFGRENIALHSACFFGRAECARLLLEAGADPRTRNEHGETPRDSMRHDRKTTEHIAGLLRVPIDFERVEAGRTRIAPWIEARLEVLEREAPAGPERRPARAGGGVFGRVATWLMGLHFFHHLWFLWFLCWLVAGFALVVKLAALLRLPPPPAALIRSPLHWLWIVPLTLAPQWFMVNGMVVPGFGPDTSTGLLPVPHVLLYYAVFFGFGALYYGAEDHAQRLGRGWWFLLPLALIVVFPVALGFTHRASWATDFAGDENTRRLLGGTLQVIYAWLMTFGLIGLFRRILSRNRPWVRYLSDASYWLYLTHLPLIIGAQAWVCHWAWPGWIKFLLILVGVTGLLLVLYRYLVRYRWLGRLLNGPRARPASGSEPA